MNDTFDRKDILPMLLLESQPFDDEDYIYELKLDGFRCIAYLGEDFTQLRSRRNKDIGETFPELNVIYNCVKKRCILDGEIVCLKNGKPDFQQLQKRNFIRDEFKIKLAASKNPVQFVAFDILYFDGKKLTEVPLIKRKQLLSENVKEDFNLSISRYVFREGVAFFNLAKQQELEGAVAKRKDGLYYPGKRTREWLKIKAVRDEELAVCGYIPDESGRAKQLILGRLEANGYPISMGKVYLPYESEREYIKNYAKTNAVLKPWFAGYESEKPVWLKLSLTGTVVYLQQTKGGNLRHAVWKGLNGGFP